MSQRNKPQATAGTASNEPPKLIMLARVPVFGQVKSRLARHIGRPQALQAHLQLLKHNVSIAQATGLRFELHVAGDASLPWFRCFVHALGVPLRTQSSGDIGDKMLAASSLDKEPDKALNQELGHTPDNLAASTASLVIGSDCGGLSVDYLLQAVDLLEAAPVVLGAAEDGGYVLIGQRQPVAALFEDIEWGTEHVAQLTRERAARAGLAVAELPLQWDVDGVVDWRRWQRVRFGSSAPN